MPERPTLLLLGDSIRMNYQPVAAKLLHFQTRVVGPADNCQFSLFTLSCLNRWIEELGPPDVVHWNNGLHDCGHNPGRYPVQIPLNMYRANLEFILERLRAQTERIVWATTTPAHPNRPFQRKEWSWRNEEINQYNHAAQELMAANDVPINDLHAVVWKDVDQYLSPDQIHLSEAGKDACARAVARAVSRWLPVQ